MFLHKIKIILSAVLFMDIQAYKSFYDAAVFCLGRLQSANIWEFYTLFFIENGGYLAEKIINVDKALRFCKYLRGKFCQEPWRPGVTEVLPFRELCPQSHVAGGKMLPVVPAGWTGRTFYFFFIQMLNH